MKGNEMLIALCARGAHPDIVGTHDIYAPLNGSWDVEVFDLEGDGARRVSSGEWHFAWVLEGRAMQDVLIAPTRDERRNGISIKGNRCATTLRIFDSASRLWRVFFFNPINQSYDIFTATNNGKDIVQTGVDAQGNALRQIFSDITNDAFCWRHEVVKDEGTSTLKVEYFAKRRA